METFYVTYGSNQRDSEGLSLGNCYTPIVAGGYSEAVDKIVAIRGEKWSFCYREADKENAIDRWNLKERLPHSVALLKGEDDEF